MKVMNRLVVLILLVAHSGLFAAEAERSTLETKITEYKSRTGQVTEAQNAAAEQEREAIRKREEELTAKKELTADEKQVLELLQQRDAQLAFDEADYTVSVNKDQKTIDPQYFSILEETRDLAAQNLNQQGASSSYSATFVSLLESQRTPAVKVDLSTPPVVAGFATPQDFANATSAYLVKAESATKPAEDAATIAQKAADLPIQITDVRSWLQEKNPGNLTAKEYKAQLDKVVANKFGSQETYDRLATVAQVAADRQGITTASRDALNNARKGLIQKALDASRQILDAAYAKFKFIRNELDSFLSGKLKIDPSINNINGQVRTVNDTAAKLQEIPTTTALVSSYLEDLTSRLTSGNLKFVYQHGSDEYKGLMDYIDGYLQTNLTDQATFANVRERLRQNQADIEGYLERKDVSQAAFDALNEKRFGKGKEKNAYTILRRDLFSPRFAAQLQQEARLPENIVINIGIDPTPVDGGKHNEIESQVEQLKSDYSILYKNDPVKLKAINNLLDYSAEIVDKAINKNIDLSSIQNPATRAAIDNFRKNGYFDPVSLLPDNRGLLVRAGEIYKNEINPSSDPDEVMNRLGINGVIDIFSSPVKQYNYDQYIAGKLSNIPVITDANATALTAALEKSKNLQLSIDPIESAVKDIQDKYQGIKNNLVTEATSPAPTPADIMYAERFGDDATKVYAIFTNSDPFSAQVVYSQDALKSLNIDQKYDEHLKTARTFKWYEGKNDATLKNLSEQQKFQEFKQLKSGDVTALLNEIVALSKSDQQKFNDLEAQAEKYLQDTRITAMRDMLKDATQRAAYDTWLASKK